MGPLQQDVETLWNQFDENGAFNFFYDKVSTWAQGYNGTTEKWVTFLKTVNIFLPNNDTLKQAVNEALLTQLPDDLRKVHVTLNKPSATTLKVTKFPDNWMEWFGNINDQQPYYLRPQLSALQKVLKYYSTAWAADLLPNTITEGKSINLIRESTRTLQCHEIIILPATDTSELRTRWWFKTIQNNKKESLAVGYVAIIDFPVNVQGDGVGSKQSTDSYKLQRAWVKT